MINEASSLAKNKIALATSIGYPTLLSMWAFLFSSLNFSQLPKFYIAKFSEAGAKFRIDYKIKYILKN